MLSQSLLPKSLGRGIEPSFMDFVNLVKKGKKMAQKVENRPAFMEGIPKELSRAAEVVNEPFLRKSELPSANFHASAKSLAKLAAMMANFGEGLEGNQRLMTHETWLKMHANEKRAFDAAMHGKVDSIPSPCASPSVKIQIMGGKVCMRCKGRTQIINRCTKDCNILIFKVLSYININKIFIFIDKNIIEYKITTFLVF